MNTNSDIALVVFALKTPTNFEIILLLGEIILLLFQIRHDKRLLG